MKDIEITPDQEAVIENAVDLAIDAVIQYTGVEIDQKDMAGSHVTIEDKIESVFWDLMDVQDLIDTDDPSYFAATKIIFNSLLEEKLHGGK